MRRAAIRHILCPSHSLILQIVFQSLLYSLASLSLSGGGAVTLKPGCELRSLLRFEIDTIVYAFERLFQSALGRGSVMGREEVGHLVAHTRVAERTGRRHDNSTSECAAQIRDVVPMRPHKIPRDPGPGWVSQYARNQVRGILRAR